VEVTQKIFRTIPHCSSKPSVFHRWVFYFTKMAKEIILTQGKVAIVDDEDFDYLNQWKWYASKDRYKFYAVRNITISKGKQKSISMHRLISNNINTKMHTDHLNGNGLDNRKINLRICTHSQNLMNSKLRKDSTSGFKGVTYCKRNNKYASVIKLNRKLIWLGYFIDPIDAARAYNDAALKYHGEFAHINKID
jgi:hypothetical protein